MIALGMWDSDPDEQRARHVREDVPEDDGRSPAPLATAAGTKSASRSASVSPRVMRSSPGTPAIASATVVVVSDGPIIAASPIARITNGNASITSVTRATTESTQPR